MYGDFRVMINEGIQPGDRIMIRDFGARVPKSKQEKHEEKGLKPADYGDHHIHLNLRIPSSLSRKEKELYERLAKFEGERMNECLEEVEIDSQNQEFKLDLKDTREYKSFISELDAWKTKGEVDVTITLDDRRIVNTNSLNHLIKKRLSSHHS
jgi:DnaJ-class molecular chaperone